METKIIKQALLKLKYTYPNAFKDYTKEDVEIITRLWCKDFADDDPNILMKAIDQIRVKSKFCPNVAEIKEEISNIKTPLGLTNNKPWWLGKEMEEEKATDEDIKKLEAILNAN